jgi:hypothetical protein
MQNFQERFRALQAPGHFQNKHLLTCGFLVLALLAAYLVAGDILSGDFTSMVFVGIGAASIVFVIAVLREWHRGLYFFIVWLLFEDFFRKFLGNNMLIYFAKDVLLAVLYIAFLAAYRRKSKDLRIFRPPFFGALAVLVWFGIAQVFNPGSPTIFFGLMGFKLYFYYLPLLLVGYAFVNSEAALRRFFNLSLALMLVIAALGIAQSILGPTFLSPAIMADDISLLSQTYRMAPISGVIVYRPTSVFVSAGRFGDLLIVSWICALGFGGYVLLRRTRTKWFSLAVLTIVAGASVMCASRGVFAWAIINGIAGAIGFVWGAPWRQRQTWKVFRGLQRVILGVALALVILFFVYPEELSNRFAVYSETLDPRSPASELLHRSWTYPLGNFLAAFESDRWPYGFGIGTASLGGQYVSRIFHVQPPIWGVESGFGSIILEMGIVGLALWLVMSLAVTVSAWRVVCKLKGTALFPIGFMIFWYALILLLPFTFTGIQAYQDFILNAYLWLLLGILFRLPTILPTKQSPTNPQLEKHTSF